MNYEEIIVTVANLAHRYFSDIYRKNNGVVIKETVDKAWINKNNTNKVDLLKFNYLDLPSDWQKEIWFSAKIALDLLLEAISLDVSFDNKFIEYASNIIHEEWLLRNIKKAKECLKLSYGDLSEFQKEEDRIFIRAAIDIYKKNRDNS